MITLSFHKTQDEEGTGMRLVWIVLFLATPLAFGAAPASAAQPRRQRARLRSLLDRHEQAPLPVAPLRRNPQSRLRSCPSEPAGVPPHGRPEPARSRLARQAR